jgi:hypothetical protein
VIWMWHQMRRDKITCARKFLVEQSPIDPLISLLIKESAEAYLLNPHMKDTVHSFLAALSGRAIDQYAE